MAIKQQAATNRGVGGEILILPIEAHPKQPEPNVTVLYLRMVALSFFLSTIPFLSVVGRLYCGAGWSICKKNTDNDFCLSAIVCVGLASTLLLL